MRSTMPALLAAAALALSACGGAGNDDDPPSRAEFVARADELCKASNRRTRALNRDVQRAAASAGGDEAAVLERLAPVLRRGSALIRDNAAALRSQDPPAGDAARIERIREAYDEQAELAGKLAAAAERGDADMFKSLSAEQADVVARARRLAGDYGFQECGSSKSDVS